MIEKAIWVVSLFWRSLLGFLESFTAGCNPNRVELAQCQIPLSDVKCGDKWLMFSVTLRYDVLILFFYTSSLQRTTTETQMATHGSVDL